MPPPSFVGSTMGYLGGMRDVDPSWRVAVLVCCNERPAGHPRGCCGREAGEALVRGLRDRARTEGVRKALVVHRTGCLDVCGAGTVAVLGAERRIVEVGGAPLEDVWSVVCKALDGAVTR
jgi:predicted metal-binding protein